MLLGAAADDGTAELVGDEARSAESLPQAVSASAPAIRTAPPRRRRAVWLDIASLLVRVRVADDRR
ncbi:hypothetical protein [Geodermatophilus sp. SYSU D00867]